MVLRPSSPAWKLLVEEKAGAAVRDISSSSSSSSPPLVFNEGMEAAGATEEASALSPGLLGSLTAAKTALSSTFRLTLCVCVCVLCVRVGGV